MQIFHRILAVLLVIIGLLFTVVGMTTPVDTGFSITEVILSPNQRVWHILTDPDRMPQWQAGLERITTDRKGELAEGMILRVYTRQYDPGLFHEDKIIRFTPEKNLTLMRIISEQNTVIRDFSQVYELKRLLNGTTELTCRIFYRCPGFLSRIYNRLHKQKIIQDQSRNNIRRLKALIENI